MPENSYALPNNLEAEQSLLGCMIMDEEILSDIITSLSEDDFYQQSHRYIFQAMKLIFADRKTVDLVTLQDRLEKDGNLENAGGIGYLTEIASSIPSTANYRHYYDIVHRDSINRRLIRIAGRIADDARRSDDEMKSLQNAESLIYELSTVNDTSTMKDIRTSDGVNAVLNKFELLGKDKNALRGIPTGFSRLDRMTNGLQKSDLIVIAARPGMGKTSFAMNIVENAAVREEKVCVVFSLEMPETQIIQRLLCSMANVSMEAALAGKLESNDWKKLLTAAEDLRKCRIFIDDSSRITPAEMLSKCRRIKARTGQLDLVMVDYIQLMSNGRENGKEQNRAQVVADITRDLKIMAKELDVPIIALSQLRRIMGKEPQLSDLRESGAIEQDADIVLFIDRKDVSATEKELDDGIRNSTIVKGIADIIVGKHRNGSIGRFKLRFKGENTKFINLTAEEEMDIAGAEKNAPRASGAEGGRQGKERMKAFGDDDGDIPFDI